MSETTIALLSTFMLMIGVILVIIGSLLYKSRRKKKLVKRRISKREIEEKGEHVIPMKSANPLGQIEKVDTRRERILAAARSHIS